LNEYAPSEEKRWRILVAITGTPEGQRALDHAIELATRTDAELVGLIIEARLPAYPATVGEVEAERRRGRPLFDTLSRLAVDQAAELGLDIEIRRRPAPVVRAILREADASSIDLVVIGRPRRAQSVVALPRLASLMRRLPCVLVIAP
jgi:nucleotide-binding universal stress UspA family protein